MTRALVALLALVLGAPVGAQPSARLGTGVDNLGSRLESLSPARPIEYFLLGEEVAAEINTDEGRALARRLFVLSYELSRAGVDPNRSEFARSVCLALLDLDLLESDDERRYVRALAAALSSQTIDAPPGVRVASSVDAESRDETAFSLATALGEYRAGRFQEASTLLAQPEVRALLAQHAPTVRNVGVMLRDVESRPNCRECRNRRIVRDDVNPDARYRLCRTCGGDPSPALAPIDLISSLRAESLLLGGEEASWSAQIAAGRVEAFVDVDPARLAERLNTPVDRPLWREGGWVATDASATPDATPAR
jgi:hypothetical protein